MPFLFRRADGLAVLRQPLVDVRVVDVVRRRHELHAAADQRLDRLVEVLRAQRDVLDALALVLLQVLLDLPLLARILVDRNADLAVGARHRARMQAGELALDVEEADLAEVEQALVEAGPFVQPAAMHVVGQVVDVEAAPRPSGFGLGSASHSKSTS